jgi:imidazole glycerol-phosphate synthase subunit HisH
VKTNPIIIGCCGANLASLTFAFARLGVDAPVSQDPDQVRRASHVVLPGVGAARDAMQRLQRAGFVDLVPTLTQPVLGICLGMQLLFAESAEEQTPCLGIVPERVARLPDAAGLPIPHMGWNELEMDGVSNLLAGCDERPFAYFVHSFAAPLGPYTRATAEYGTRFSAVIEHANFFGTQFHPERSAATGARILANFLEL